MIKKRLYTFGYTLFQRGTSIDIERMFQTLNALGVGYLIDVRSVPYSKQYPQSNASTLNSMSRQFGVRYVHMPELGAKADPTQDVFSKAEDIFFEDIFPISKSSRPEKTELFGHQEIVDFNKFRTSEYFLDGISRIKTAYEKDCTLALMCSEKHPINCHRYFLVSTAVERKLGDMIEVHHFVANQNGDIVTLSNYELNNQLRQLVFEKKEIKRLDVLSSSFEQPEPLIEKYFGNTQEEQIMDFCDRYWNLIHGWKKVINDKSDSYND